VDTVKIKWTQQSQGHSRTRTTSIQKLYRQITRGEILMNKLCGRPPPYAHAPCKLTFDHLTLKVVSESRVT